MAEGSAWHVKHTSGCLPPLQDAQFRLVHGKTFGHGRLPTRPIRENLPYKRRNLFGVRQLPAEEGGTMSGGEWALARALIQAIATNDSRVTLWHQSKAPAQGLDVHGRERQTHVPGTCSKRRGRATSSAVEQSQPRDVSATRPSSIREDGGSMSTGHVLKKLA